ncbi:MAG: 50S ribosomal protein L13 [Candidatus Kerfeldbacteria bacterium]|nr:50S ribosomal protein L13 [Candidatus Kerfeldbacteria bacterium]
MVVDRQTVDAEGQALGRVASRAALLLRGKHRPDFDPARPPHVRVTVAHAARVRLTGKKWEQRKYARFSGYPGGLKLVSASTLFARSPEQVIRLAVARMLPANKLRPKLLRRLKVEP